MVAAIDKTAFDPALAALDPCGEPILVEIAEQPPDVTAPKAMRPGGDQAAQVLASPYIAVPSGPASAGGEHSVRPGVAAANPQPGIAPDPCGQLILVEIAEKPADVTAPKPKRLGEAETMRTPASPDFAIASGPAFAGGEPPIKPGEAAANPQPGIIAAIDKTASDPALAAADPSGQPSPAMIAERPPDVTAAKAVRPGEAATMQAPASPDIAVTSGPASAGGEPPIRLGDAVVERTRTDKSGIIATAQPHTVDTTESLPSSALASVVFDNGVGNDDRPGTRNSVPAQRSSGRSAGAMAPAQAIPPPQLAASRQSTAPLSVARDLIEPLLRRGDELLKIEDITAARLLYERAAKAGSARAAMLAGKTYDPLYFAEIGARGIVADRTKAMDWYGKAAGLGDREAKARLEKLRAEAQQ
jgi:hypothetical protein